MNISRTSLKRIVQEEFLTSEQANQLMAVGIEDGPHLVRTWRKPQERQRLADAVGMPVEELEPAVFIANLLMQEAPGQAGIDLLLHHRNEKEVIRKFIEAESDPQFPCLGRQEILKLVGNAIRENRLAGINHLQQSKVRSFAKLFGFAILVMVGVTVYANWNAVSGRFGPDVMSQLAQSMGRREVLTQVGVIFLLLGVGTVFLWTAWIMGAVDSKLDGYIDTWLKRTPRDVLVWQEAQTRIPAQTAAMDKLLDGISIFIWAIPILVGSLLPSAQWLASLISVLCLGGWIYFKIQIFNLTFDKFDKKMEPWAHQARARQAGLILIKMITSVLLVLSLYFIWFIALLFVCQGAQYWTQIQVQTANTEMPLWLAQQASDPAALAEMNAFILERTRSWTEFTQTLTEFWVSWLPLATQVINFGLFGIACGAALGWFVFISSTHAEPTRLKGWAGWVQKIKERGVLQVLLALTIIYMVTEIWPDLAVWWLVQVPKNGYGLRESIVELAQVLKQNIFDGFPGLTVGLFLALGQKVFDTSQDHQLTHECPECHVLMAKPTCECGRQHGFQKVLDLQ